MWYCKECDLEFEEPGTWNANAKKFLCANCFSPLSEQAVEHRMHTDEGEAVRKRLDLIN